MVSRMFRCSLKAIAQNLLALLVSFALLFSFSQPAALAITTAVRGEPAPYLQLALAASSRFAAQAESEGQEPTISEARLEEMREQRREWQSEVSAAAAAEAAQAADESVGEAVKDRLNLKEITQENQIVDELKNR